MNADYDTRDTLKPVMKADFDMQNIGVKDAFNTFNTVKKLAPAAKGIRWKNKCKTGIFKSSWEGYDAGYQLNKRRGKA